MDDFSRLATHLASTDTVTVITTRPNGDEVATPIWAVAVDGVGYVRPAYGPRTSWYLRARSGRPTAFTTLDGHRAEVDPTGALADPRVAVLLNEVTDPDILDQVDAAFRSAYASSPHLPSVLDASARAGTLRVSRPS